jgi:hypothetical protein
MQSSPAAKEWAMKHIVFLIVLFAVLLAIILIFVPASVGVA